MCNSGLSDSILQKNIDYACGAGADCSAILQNGACFNPNTVKDHCNYAVNSYYQRKGQITGSCDFQGTATVTQTVPSKSLKKKTSESPKALFLFYNCLCLDADLSSCLLMINCRRSFWMCVPI